jgi:hypothetical protein
VAEDSEFARLKSLGYTRLRDYAGSGVEGGKRGYYSSTVAGANLFHQGIMQTVHRSVFGIDPASGRTLTGITAGGVPTDPVLAESEAKGVNFLVYCLADRCSSRPATSRLGRERRKAARARTQTAATGAETRA